MIARAKVFITSKNNLPGIVFLTYVFLQFLLLFYHEPWRDELQAFSIAQQSHSLSELYQNKAYEGHPMLWFIILYAITRFSDSIFLMKVIHLGISCATIYVFIKYCPLKEWLKYLAVFGYFFIYEYSVISRNYCIGLLLAFAFCALINRKAFLTSALLLFLLLQTNIFGLFIGCSLWLIYVWNHWQWRSTKFWLANCIVLSGTIISAITTIPPPDSDCYPEWHFQGQVFGDRFPVVWDVFLPIPQFNIHFWNTNFTDNTLSFWHVTDVKIAGGIIILLFCVYALRTSSKALMFFLLSASVIFAFLSVKFRGSLRHQGHLFIAFIIALWLKEIFPDTKRPLFLITLSRSWINKLLKSVEKNFLILLLLIQAVAGAAALYYDLCYPFSNATAVADYIRKNKPGYYIVGNYDPETSAVAIALGHKIFYPRTNDESLFIKWSYNRRWVPDDSVIAITINKQREFKKALLVSSYEMDDSLLRHHGISLVKKFDPCIIEDEQFFIYQ